MAQTKQYVLGRGKLFFARFKEGTQEPDGFLYFGNTPEFSLTIESEDLPHYNADEGVREEDDSVTLEVTRTGTLVTDNINPENVALFLLGSSTALVQAPVASQTIALSDIKAGHSYELGQDDITNPTGFAGIDPSTFAVTIGAAAAATGTITISGGVPTAADTVAVGDRTYTFVSVVAGANQVLIGVDADATGANLANAINGTGGTAGTDYSSGIIPHADVSASAVAGAVTVTAKIPGTDGNAIVLTAAADNTAVSGGGTLAGGTGTVLVEKVDYTMDFDAGFLSFVDGSAHAVDGASVNVTFTVRGSSRSVVLSGNQPVEGALVFVTKNPKGPDSKLRMGWVKLSPNGDYNLKGDEWQQIPLTVRVMKPENQPAFRRDGKPVYA